MIGLKLTRELIYLVRQEHFKQGPCQFPFYRWIWHF